VEDYNWGYFQFPSLGSRFNSRFNLCISILYAIIGYVLCRLGQPRMVYWMQVMSTELGTCIGAAHACCQTACQLLTSRTTPSSVEVLMP
jgi:hypothetical protein